MVNTFFGLGKVTGRTGKRFSLNAVRLLFQAVLAVLCAAGLTGCIDSASWGAHGFGWRSIEGSGNVIAEARDVSGFDRVSVMGSGELTLAQGDEEGLTIEADDNLLPVIVSEVRGGHLIIGPENVSVRPSTPIRYQLKFRDLTELHLSGSVRAEADAIKTDRLALHISGSGRVQVPKLEASMLSTHISGSGSATAAGQVARQEIRISGSGNHHAPELRSDRADVHISGSGNASLWVDEILAAHISGSGRVEYRGAPQVESHLSGSGRVIRR
jgi:hypothetical protein